MGEKKYIVCNAVTGAVTSDRCDTTYIVRCKDCAYGRRIISNGVDSENLYICYFSAGNILYGDHYCSWGTPKT